MNAGIQLLKSIIAIAIMMIYVGDVSAQNDKEAPAHWAPNLSLKDIHYNGTFSGEIFKIGAWSESGPLLQYIEPVESGKSTNLISLNLEDGHKQELISGQTLWAEDINRLVVIEDFEFSEDGNFVLIFTDSEPVWRAKTKGFYYLYDLKTNCLSAISNRELGFQMFAKLSPDGSNVAFVRERNLYVVNLADGVERRLTSDGSKGGIINGTFDWVYEEEFGLRDGWSWSPDGQSIAFFKLDESRTRDFAMTDLRNQYPQYVSFRYPKAGERNSRVKVGIIDISSGETSFFETGTWAENDDGSEYIARMGWTPPVGGSSSVWMMKLNRDQNELDLLFGKPSTGKLSTILHEKEATWIEVSDKKLTFLENGKHFVWQTEVDGFRHLNLYESDGTFVAPVTSGHWDVTQFHGIDEASSTAYFTGTIANSIERQLYGISVDFGEMDSEARVSTPYRITSGTGVHNISMSSDLAYYIDEFSDASSPITWTLNTSEGSHIASLEDNARLKKMLSKIELVEPEFVQIPGADGTLLNAYLIKPRAFSPSSSYPLLMYVYGGPGSQTVMDSWGGTNYLWHHYLANELNIVVASVDNRGTGGRGKKFKSSTYKHLGQIEAEDQIAAAQYLGEFSYINEDRIGIWGWSYGGYMTLMSMLYGEGPDTFKMGVSVAPVSDWRLYDTIYTERYMSTPQKNPEGYKAGSPTSYASNLKASQKLLIMHGDFDDNVHFQNSIQMIDALQAANKQFDFMPYPGKNHSIVGGHTRLNLFTKATMFIKDNL